MSDNEAKQRHLFENTGSEKSYRIDLRFIYLAITVLLIKGLLPYWLEILTWCGDLACSALLFPLQCILPIIFSKSVAIGFFLSTFSWQIMYMNSNIPGVDPPSPFSPQKYKRYSSSEWHLNYAMAALIGPLVTILLALGVV